MTVGQRPRASVVVVSYGSEATLRGAVLSVDASDEVVVVEQRSTGRAASIALAARSDAVVVNAGENRGFGAGCNLGAANSSSQFIVFLNPDAELTHGAVDALVSALEDPKVAVAGPTLLDDSDRVATEARNFSYPMSDLLDLLAPKLFIPVRLRRDIAPSDPLYRDGGRASYVQGACFAVRKRSFFEVGGFNEQFFLYGEEESLARKFAVRDEISVLVPNAVVRHIGQTSTDAVGDFAIEQRFRSLVLIYRQAGGASTAWTGSLALAVGLALLILTRPVRALIGYRPDETTSWCASALRGLWSGLLGKRVSPPHGLSTGPWERD